MKSTTLSPLDSKIKRYSFTVFDLETVGKRNDYYICGIINNNSYKAYFNRLEAIRYLLNHRNKDLRVSTNLDFDLQQLFFKTKYFKKFKLIQSNGKTICATIRISNRSIKFIDALNFGGLSVEKQGEIINIKKSSKPICLGRKPFNLSELEELLEYNYFDCLITLKFMVYLQSGFNNIGCQLKITIASTSLDLFRRKYLKQTIIKEESRIKGINDLLFQSYYGGRTEVYRRGRIGTVNVYDVNSLYPSVMCEEKYPNPNSVKLILKKDCNLKFIFDYEGVSEVKVFCPYMKIPLLPYRHKGKLLFPTGTFTSSYTHIELRRAITLGYKILSINHSIIYLETARYFKDFVTELYNERVKHQKNNSSMQLIYKLLLNSSYGKFAQKYNNELVVLDKKKGCMYNDDYIIGKEFVYKNIQTICEASHVLPILSIYITAYARLKLFDYLTKYKVYYCDTDSCFTKDLIKTSNKLGDMKLETKAYNCLVVRPKLYFYDSTKSIVKAKGFPKITSKEFLTLIKGKKHKYMKMSKLKESIKKGINPNTWIEVVKSMNLEDNKRKWKNKFNYQVVEDSEPITLNS